MNRVCYFDRRTYKGLEWDDNYYTPDDLIAENKRYVEGCVANGLYCDVITDDYEAATREIVKRCPFM